MVSRDWSVGVRFDDISAIYVTAHRFAAGLKKKFVLLSVSHAIDSRVLKGSPMHRQRSILIPRRLVSVSNLQTD